VSGWPYIMLRDKPDKPFSVFTVQLRKSDTWVSNTRECVNGIYYENFLIERELKTFRVNSGMLSYSQLICYYFTLFAKVITKLF